MHNELAAAACVTPSICSEDDVCSSLLLLQVAVNSGGKHCLALSAEGEVYSWGEGDDGKLGHGNRRCVLVFSRTSHTHWTELSMVRRSV
jgi:alpha-tubulin suppressor-like RCC1 family protein